MVIMRRKVMMNINDVDDMFAGIVLALRPHAVARLVQGLPPSVLELILMVMEIVMATAMAMPCR